VTHARASRPLPVTDRRTDGGGALAVGGPATSVTTPTAAQTLTTIENGAVRVYGSTGAAQNCGLCRARGVSR